ncbi:hypothetical protein B0A55_01343 [Friedmanniomyces simplex]|uniref:Arabinan endo-1,5-alpha-L-arabinosidase A n=1 Tax=Friedmanniomyces simplex TaxID=329884 RepID=A0A4U0Y276_9PEZI|nr:hypothetical protein B0A55_01343 [Friedmanniomyces simplex]
MMLFSLGLGSLFLTTCFSSPISQPKLSFDGIPTLSLADAPVSRLDNSNAKNSLADPSVIQTDDGHWYAFATRSIGSAIHIQAAQSSDYETWELVVNADGSQYDALPSMPAWVGGGPSSTWAPDVVQVADGSYIMYYSATAAASLTHHCIGAATASSVLGPYTPVGSEAMFCPLDQGGAIDASGFIDDGQRYVVYKVDGNSMGHGGACRNAVAPFVSTPIVLQPVAADGVTFNGAATTLLDNAGASDQGVVEAPALTKSGSTYVLFFSSNCFSDGHYTLSYAISTSVTGPYTRAAKPLLQSGDNEFTSPGGADVHVDGQHMVFHAAYNGGRAMYQAVISVVGDFVSF